MKLESKMRGVIGEIKVVESSKSVNIIMKFRENITYTKYIEWFINDYFSVLANYSSIYRKSTF